MLQIVDVELTPNPHALKFVLNEKLLEFESRNYKSLDEVGEDLWVKDIFNLEGVESVFYMEKFITIEKKPESQWGGIQRGLISIIKNLDKSKILPEKEIPEEEISENELLQKINLIIDQKVRPALANDGGGLKIMGLDGYRLKVRYQGACGSCPSATRGTLAAIENLLRRDVSPSIVVIPD